MVCCVYHDRQRIWRDIMREYEWYFEDRPHTAEFLKFDVLVTTYDTLIGDFDVISQIPFRVSVVDEAHRRKYLTMLPCVLFNTFLSSQYNTTPLLKFVTRKENSLNV